MTSKRMPPGPKGLPILGSVMEFRRDPLGFITRLARDYGDVSLFGVPISNRVVLVNSPELIKEILVDKNRAFTKSSDYKLLKFVVGEGLLTSEGDFHRRQRRLAAPAFHRQRIEAYGAIMSDFSRRTADRWTAGSTVDVSQEMMRLTLGVVAKALFGADIERGAQDVGRAVTDLLALFDNLLLLVSPRLFQLLPLPSRFRYQRALQTLDSTIYRIIDEGRRTGEDRGDLLTMLLRSVDEEGDGTGMSNKQLRDEALTIFLAGHETTANALTWAFYLLSQHPEVEEKLHAEIDSALDGREPRFEDLPKLPYTQKVFNETMRMYPPAWVVGRRTTTEYPLGEFTIPPETDVILSPWVTQHDSRFFDDPWRFDPERWNEGPQSGRPEFSYFPFGGGPRTCIGESFARLEGVLVTAAIAQQWRLRLAPGHKVELAPLVTLRPKHGMQMVTEKREPATRPAKSRADQPGAELSAVQA